MSRKKCQGIFNSKSGCFEKSQVSFETANFGHGIFTYHFLEALDGKADFDADQAVKLLETYMYVQREVAMTARKLGQVQQPKLMGNVSGAIILASPK